MDNESIIHAINEYFRGEHYESALIVCGSLIFIGLAIALYLIQRDDFARAFGIVTLLGAIVFMVAGGWLLIRDPPHQAKLIADTQTAQANEAINAESNRIADIFKVYPRLKYTVFTLSLLSLAAIFFTKNGTVNGIAASILIIAATQFIVDHYSEKRARVYFNEIAEWRKPAR